MLEEKTFVDMISWRPELGTIEVRNSAVVYKDGAEIARNYHRHVVGPGDDVSKEDPSVQAVADLFKAERARRAAIH